MSSCSDVLDACQNMDICLERVIELLSNFTSFYIENKDLDRSKMVIDEMEKIETEFNLAYETVWAYLDSRASVKSSALFESRSIDEDNRSKIEEGTETDTCYKTQMQTTSVCALDKVRTYDQNNMEKLVRITTGPFVSTEDMTTPSIGHDMWTQLKRVEIPVFSGNKRTYPSWRAAFLACIDKAPVSPEYKMLQLRQYVSGDALRAIENLGHSPSAYEAAKDRLERKYGGKRRQKAILLDDIEQFRQVQPGNAEDLEHFADLLDLTIINLTEADEFQDLGDGTLYTHLQRKLPQHMLARYHRWIFEKSMTESVESLKTWVAEESRFQTIASETVNGLTGQNSNTQSTESKRESIGHRTFFINVQENYPEQPCQLCKEQHIISDCHIFLRENVQECWNIAKRFQLCFRCLEEGHEGKSCRKTQICGTNQQSTVTF